MSLQQTLIPETCRSCGAPILWAVVDRSGRRLALDPEPAPVRISHVAYNAATGRCHVIAGTDVGHVARWVERGPVSVHRTHWASCGHPERWRAHQPPGEPA